METLQNNHRYTPLSTGCLEIRVLRLFPGIDHDSPVRGELWHINLESDWHPAYDALSYTWGDTSLASAQSIEIDGNENFLVTPNACQALKDLRLSHRPFLMWVDAICIDQQNVSERNSQVQIMSKIYSTAETVKTWLDCEIPEEVGLLDILDSSALDDLTSLDERSHARNILSNVSAILERITALPYWTRVWIQQEVRRARVLDGHHKGLFSHDIYFRRDALSSWELEMYLRYAPSLLREAGIKPKYRTDPASIINLLRGDLRTKENHMHGHLLEALTLASAARLQATNPKDFVYGLLGAVDDHRISELSIDYTATVSQAFTKAAIYIVKRHQSVDFLIHAQGLGVDNIMPNLPTWVPRWSDPCEALRGRYAFEDDDDETSAKVTAMEVVEDSTTAQLPRVSFCAKYLHVRGRRLGTIMCSFQHCILSSVVTSSWPVLHKYLKGLGFDFKAVFETFREFGTEWSGAYSLPEMGNHIIGKELEDHNSLLDLARGMVDEDVPTNISDIPSHVRETFEKIQRHFNKECEKRTLVVTEERDLGLANMEPELVRPGDEIWAIERCAMFLVLRPRGNRFQLLGSVRISRFYPPEGSGWSGRGLCAALEYKGKGSTARELILE